MQKLPLAEVCCNSPVGESGIDHFRKVFFQYPPIGGNKGTRITCFSRSRSCVIIPLYIPVIFLPSWIRFRLLPSHPGATLPPMAGPFWGGLLSWWLDAVASIGVSFFENTFFCVSRQPPSWETTRTSPSAQALASLCWGRSSTWRAGRSELGYRRSDFPSICPGFCDSP